jgi:hypothetical protein
MVGTLSELPCTLDEVLTWSPSEASVKALYAARVSDLACDDAVKAECGAAREGAAEWVALRR